MNETEKNLNEELIEKNDAPAEETPAAEAPAAKIPAAEIPAAGKPKSKLKLPAIIAAAGAVVAAAVIGISAAAASPLSLLGKGLTGAVESLQKNQLVTVLTSAFKGGSAEVILDLETLLGGMVDGGASVKVYANEKQEAAVVADLVIDDESVLDATAVLNKDSLAVSSEVLFGDKVYGIDLKNLSKNFNDSVFGPDGAYSLDVELEDDSDLIAKGEKLTEAGKQVSADAVKVLTKSLKENAEVSKAGEAVTFAGEQTKVTAVTVKLNDETAAAVAADLLDYARTDEKLKAFLTDAIAYSIEVNGGELEDYDDADDFVDDFYDALDDLDADDLADLLDEAKFSFSSTFYISKSGKQLVGVDFTVKADGERVRFSASFGPSWDKLNEISVKLSSSDTAFEASYLVTENSKTDYVAEVEIEADGDVIEGTFAWDKTDGDFEFELEDEYSSFSIDGELALSAKEMTLILDTIHEDDYKRDVGATLILKADDKMPAMPKYTNLLKMTEEEVDDLVDDLQGVAQDLAFLLWMF